LVLSDGYWRRRFEANTSVLGRQITLAGHSFTVIGVTPAWFTDVSIETSPEVRVPLATGRLLTGMEASDPELYASFEVAARLGARSTAEQARGDLDATGAVGAALIALLAGTGLLMVMVTANVVGLLAARSAAGARESRVRLAVGASRWRLARLMLAESALLAGAGIGVGVVIA
jgi:hypothetical protein